MSNLRAINQQAPFWDFMASLQNQADGGDRRQHRGPMPHRPPHHQDHPRGREPPPPGLFDDADFVEGGVPPPNYEGSPDTMMGEKEVNEKRATDEDESDGDKDKGKGPQHPHHPHGHHHHGPHRGHGFRGRGRHCGGGPRGWGRRGGPSDGEDTRGPFPFRGPAPEGVDEARERGGFPFAGPESGSDERGPFPFRGPGGPFSGFAGFFGGRDGGEDRRGGCPFKQGGRHAGRRGGFPFGGPGGPFGFMQQGRGNGDFNPEFDVFDTETHFVVHVALAGAKKEDVGVNWDPEKSELAITGVITRAGDEEFIKALAIDGRAVGPFEAKVRLGTQAAPALVEPERITAKLDDGVLVIEVPKVEKEYVDVKKVEIE